MVHYRRVAFNFDMRILEGNGVPGIPNAVDRIRIVIEPVIPDDLRAFGIGGANCGAATDEPTRLIKIGGLGDIGRNQRIIFTEFGDAIHLDGQKDRYAGMLKLSRQIYGFGSAPAMSIDDDARALLLFG